MQFFKYEHFFNFNFQIRKKKKKLEKKNIFF